MSTETGKANCERAEAAGLVRAYFPNGTAFMLFEERCEQCRHFIDDLHNPKPGRLEPPFNCCKWGVLDRIYEASATDRYGYGKSYHQPEDMEPGGCPPECKRWTAKDDDDPSREPPRPDVPGQMMLDEVLTVEEHAPTPRALARADPN